MERIYGKEVIIDDNKVKEFWEERSLCYDEEHPYVAVKLNDKNTNFSESWDVYEKEQILTQLNIDENSIVLDIGCGMGRLSEMIIPKAKYYLGTDFSEGLIDIAKKRTKFNKEYDFISVAFQELNLTEVRYKGQYNKVIIAGVFMYINDQDIKVCLENLLNLLGQNCIIYISNPIAIEERLTLREWESEDFELKYNAIYRTIEEYKQLLKPLFDNGFRIECNVDKDPFLNKLSNYKDTGRNYFILKRD